MRCSRKNYNYTLLLLLLSTYVQKAQKIALIIILKYYLSTSFLGESHLRGKKTALFIVGGLLCNATIAEFTLFTLFDLGIAFT